MNMIDQTDKTHPPRRSMRYDTPAELFASLPQVRDLTQIRPRADEDNLQYLFRLRGSTTPEEAVTFTSFAALPTVAAGWGYECLRQMADHLSPLERPLMQDIAAWIANPVPGIRYKVMREALWAPSRSPSVLLGLAVGWSTVAGAAGRQQRRAVLPCAGRTVAASHLPCAIPGHGRIAFQDLLSG